MKQLYRISCMCLAAVLLYSCSMKVALDDDEEDGVRNHWTTVIYMAADNDLESAALSDFRELEAAAEREDHTVLVLFDGGGCGDTRLYRVHHNPDPTGVEGPVASEELACGALGLTVGGWNEVNMASPYVLKTLLDYVSSVFPAEQLSLILWGYGTGFRSTATTETVSRAVATDDSSGVSMSLSQLGSVLAGRSLSFLGFDTSYGITLEQLYELKDSADFIGGVPGLAAAAGWDYTQLLNTWDQEYAAKVFAMGNDNGVVVDTKALPAVFAAFQEFCGTVSNQIDCAEKQSQVLDVFMNEATRYEPEQYPCDVYVDIYSLAVLFDDALLQQAVAECCIATSGSSPSISVFLTAVSGVSVSVASHPAQYTKGNGTPGQCAFVRKSTGWCPTVGHKGKTLLDRLFYSSW